MGRPIGPRKVHRYSTDFKLAAVKLSGMPGVQVQTVAAALDVHPFMAGELERLLRSYIPYYNGVRLHSGIGYCSPVDYEARAT